MYGENPPVETVVKLCRDGVVQVHPGDAVRRGEDDREADVHTPQTPGGVTHTWGQAFTGRTGGFSLEQAHPA